MFFLGLGGGTQKGNLSLQGTLVEETKKSGGRHLLAT